MKLRNVIAHSVGLGGLVMVMICVILSLSRGMFDSMMMLKAHWQWYIIGFAMALTGALMIRD